MLVCSRFFLRFIYFPNFLLFQNLGAFFEHNPTYCCNHCVHNTIYSILPFYSTNFILGILIFFFTFKNRRKPQCTLIYLIILSSTQKLFVLTKLTQTDSCFIYIYHKSSCFIPHHPIRCFLHGFTNGIGGQAGIHLFCAG